MNGKLENVLIGVMIGFLVMGLLLLAIYQTADTGRTETLPFRVWYSGTQEVKVVKYRGDYYRLGEKVKKKTVITKVASHTPIGY